MKIECLNNNYSTTRLVNKKVDLRINSSHIENINNQYANTPITNNQFETILFLPEGENRQGVGGFRTKGYFKHSYKKVIRDKEQGISEEEWWIVDRDDNPVEKVSLSSISCPLLLDSYTSLPLISIITVVYNGKKYLEETIQSVINQTYPNVEYIIIDGGSTDGTIDIIKKYEDKIDYWVSEKDKGIYDAWNKAIQLALGDWLAFLGADDEYLPNAIEGYIKHIQLLNDDIDYISSKADLVSDRKIVRVVGSSWRWEKFIRYMNVVHVGSLHSRQLFRRVGLYNPRLKIVGDYELLLRAGPEIKCEFLNHVTVKMRVDGVSNSNLKVFFETAQVKIQFGGRHKFIVCFEALYSIIKWGIRKLFWY